MFCIKGKLVHLNHMKTQLEYLVVKASRRKLAEPNKEKQDKEATPRWGMKISSTL